MRNLIFLAMLLQLNSVSISAFSQIKPPAHLKVDEQQEQISGELEQMAMCHHAIKAAYHEASALGQNPYYRYIINMDQHGHNGSVYPMPERCQNLATNWTLAYTGYSNNGKNEFDQFLSKEVGITIPLIAKDAQFLSVVVFKMGIEGEKAGLLENEDKDVPLNP